MDFISRHLGPDAAERETMLKAVGYDSVEALVDAALPTSIRATEALNLPEAVSYTHLTLPTTARRCRSRWSPYH